MKKFWKRAFFCYCALMLWLLFGQRIGQAARGGVNLVPFYTIKNYCYVIRHPYSDSILRHVIINLVGNVVMFVPLGFFLPKLWRGQRRFFKFLLTVILVIAAIEAVQLCTMLGSLDVDDLILNTAGGVIGYIFCWIWENFAGRNRDSLLQ